MSVPTVCPQCGSRMVPRDLRDEDGADIGISWMCAKEYGGCGYQMTDYKPGYWERLEAEQEAREKAERDAILAANPDEYRLHVKDEHGQWAAIGVYSHKEDALEAGKSLGREWYVSKWVFNLWTLEYERWGAVARGAVA